MGNKMKEYHYLKVVENGLTQEIITTVDNRNDNLYITELWVRTFNDTTESKIKVNLPSLAQQIQQGNSEILQDQDLKKVFDIFGEILDPDQLDEHQLDNLIASLRNKLTESQTLALIKAAELALHEHPTDQSIEDIVNDKLKKQ
jgi:hypothetical protein